MLFEQKKIIFFIQKSWYFRMLYTAYILDTIRGLSYYAYPGPFGIDYCIPRRRTEKMATEIFNIWQHCQNTPAKGLNPDKPEITNYKHHLILKLGQINSKY